MKTAMRDWEQRFAKLGGEPGVIDRMRARYATEVDVESLGKDCVDFAQRKPVSNITGLFVTRVRSAAARATRGAPMSAEKKLEEAERHAAYAIYLYQIISEQGLTPNRIADMLDEAVRTGMLVNTRTIDRLREMGDRWPGR